MAAKKKHHRKTHRRMGKTHKRRRHVSGRKTTRKRRGRMGAGPALHEAVLFAAGIAGGAIVTPFIVQGITTAMGSGASSIPGWMVPAGGFATGAVVAGMGVAHKNPLITGFGGGMAAIGAVMAANEAGLSEPGISGTAFANNAAPGATAVTKSVGCKKVGSPQRFINNTVGSVSRLEAQAIGALYSN